MEKIITQEYDVLDILFQNKNKAYGAYNLRRTYAKRLYISLFSMLLLISASIFITNNIKKDKQAINRNTIIDLTIQPTSSAKKTAPPVIPPLVEKINKEPVKLAITKFITPKVAKDNLVKEVIKEQSELTNLRIGIKDQEGLKTNAVAPPVYVTGEGGKEFVNIAASVTNKKIEEEIFATIQVKAEYPGDWENYLRRNLNAELPVENGAPAGTYKVTVSFVVAKDGKVSEVKALNNPGFGTAEEAVRVIKKSGNWNPGIQNNIKVNSYRKQSIVFLVQ